MTVHCQDQEGGCIRFYDDIICLPIFGFTEHFNPAYLLYADHYRSLWKARLSIYRLLSLIMSVYSPLVFIFLVCSDSALSLIQHVKSHSCNRSQRWCWTPACAHPR